MLYRCDTCGHEIKTDDAALDVREEHACPECIVGLCWPVDEEGLEEPWRFCGLEGCEE